MSETHLNAYRFELEEKRVQLTILQGEVDALQALVDSQEPAVEQPVTETPVAEPLQEKPAEPVAEVVPAVELDTAAPADTVAPSEPTGLVG